jgi:hypothetical protein
MQLSGEHELSGRNAQSSHPAEIKAPADDWDRRRLKFFKLGRVEKICGESHVERLHVSCGIERK